MTPQSNPVLFVLVGSASALAADLTRMLESYRLRGTACVMVPDPGNTTHLPDEIHRIQQAFLRHRYTTAGLIRVGFILHDEADMLPSLRYRVDEYLSPLYPSGAVTDVYWLSDETSALDLDRRVRARNMRILGNGLAEAQIYILSNLNSESRHTHWIDILQTIALLTLFKDGEPKEYAAPPDASRYNEFMFLQNTHNGKPFLTAGSLRLQVPMKALRALLITALLNPLPLPEMPAPELNLPGAVPWKPSEDFIYGIAIPPDRGIPDNVTRMEIIESFFGKRLDAVAEMHPPVCEAFDPLAINQALEPYGLFDILQISAPGGPWQTELESAISQNEGLIISSERNLRLWLEEIQEAKTLKNDKRHLSFFRRAANFPYSIAAEYLTRVCAMRAYKVYAAELSKLLAHVKEIYAKWQERDALVKELRETYEPEAAALTIASSPLASTDEYFLQLFAEHALANENHLRALAKQLGNADTLSMLENYIDTRLLKDPVFARPFTEILAQVADGKSLVDWAADNRHTHIRLRTGSSVLYSEINLHMPGEWAAQVKYGYEALGLGRANLFTDSTANRVSVLYHAGAFGPADLYYADLYKY